YAGGVGGRRTEVQGDRHDREREVAGHIARLLVRGDPVADAVRAFESEVQHPALLDLPPPPWLPAGDAEGQVQSEERLAGVRVAINNGHAPVDEKPLDEVGRIRRGGRVGKVDEWERGRADRPGVVALARVASFAVPIILQLPAPALGTRPLLDRLVPLPAEAL